MRGTNVFRAGLRRPDYFRGWAVGQHLCFITSAADKQSVRADRRSAMADPSLSRLESMLRQALPEPSFIKGGGDGAVLALALHCEPLPSRHT